MIGLLGDIVLENAEVQPLESDFGGEFIEHARFGLKPLLQATGETLTEIRLSFELHVELGDPDARLNQLQALRAQQLAAPLMLAGDYRGYFVIPSLSVIDKWRDNDGNILYQSVSITLREYAGKKPVSKDAAGIRNAGDPVSTQTFTNSNSASPAHLSLKEAVAASKQALDELSNQIDLINEYERLTDAEAQANKLAQIQTTFEKAKSLAQSGVDALVKVSQTYNSVMTSVDQAKASVAAIKTAANVLKPPFDPSTLQDRIAMAQGQLGGAQQLMTTASSPLTAIAARVAVRAE